MGSFSDRCINRQGTLRGCWSGSSKCQLYQHSHDPCGGKSIHERSKDGKTKDGKTKAAGTAGGEHQTVKRPSQARQKSLF